MQFGPKTVITRLFKLNTARVFVCLAIQLQEEMTNFCKFLIYFGGKMLLYGAFSHKTLLFPVGDECHKNHMTEACVSYVDRSMAKRFKIEMHLVHFY